MNFDQGEYVVFSTNNTNYSELTLSTGTLGSGCGDFGDHSFIVSFTPTEKYVDYYDKIIITDGKATPSTIEIPVHLYSTGFNQTLEGFSLPATCLTTDEVEMPVVTTNTGLTPVEFLSSDSAIAYVENNVLKILKAGSVDIIAYQAGDDRYNEVSETKTIDIQLAPSTILQAPEALMIAVGSELSVSTLRNGQADVEGTFAWADGSEVLTTAGDFEREVIFVPSADTIYAPASVMVTVSVTDGAAITEYPTLSDIVNLLRNHSVIRSRYPFTNRLIPNLLTPCSRLRCCTTFSPIFVNPAFFAKNGIYRCISLNTSMFFTTSRRYAFNPQFMS